jgi:hypothetical protein
LITPTPTKPTSACNNNSTEHQQTPPQYLQQQQQQQQTKQQQRQQQQQQTICTLVCWEETDDADLTTDLALTWPAPDLA